MAASNLNVEIHLSLGNPARYDQATSGEAVMAYNRRNCSQQGFYFCDAGGFRLTIVINRDDCYYRYRA